MKLAQSPAEHEVRARYVSWLLDFLPSDYAGREADYHWDLGLRREHQRAAFEAGWLMPSWPREWGGQSLGPIEAMVVRVEGGIRSAPKLPNVAGVNVVAPGLRDFGTDQQIESLMVPLLRGDEWWALGMSEPGAGSDFAGLRTTAVRDGDVFRVNGQKVWTTQAHLSRWATLYVRTDPEAPKHRGISCLILDLEAKGVSIRPVPMCSISDETFCEVFLDDVEIPVTSLLGPENSGWRVAMSSLNHERDMIWIMNWVQIEKGLRELSSPALDDDLLGELGSLLADAEALKVTGYRTLAATMRGVESPEFHIMKLLGSEALQRTWELVALAASSASSTDRELTFERQDALASTIYGGTSEVQRTIIGERVLGLPKA